jgi:hypothetical protein
LPAAEAGDACGQYNLGYMFKTGKGVKANLVKATEWYQKGMLSRILQNINTLSVRARFIHQLRKLDYQRLSSILD